MQHNWEFFPVSLFRCSQMSYNVLRPMKGTYNLSVDFWLLWFKLIQTKVDPTLESAKFVIRWLCSRSALQAPVVHLSTG